MENRLAMISYSTASTDEDLRGILQLQQQNLAVALSETEIRSEGFVTVKHSLDDLQRLNNMEQHVIAKKDEKVVAYLLAMTEDSKDDIPLLRPMFAVFQELSFAGKMLTHYRYLVVGQVCVGKGYRGQGILDQCYRWYKQNYSDKYDFAITEIDAINLRSLAAHKRVGFRELHRYPVPGGKEWVIVLWDWNDLAVNDRSAPVAV
jgi:L-amino acid N-acyltransferase YncA